MLRVKLLKKATYNGKLMFDYHQAGQLENHFENDSISINLY